MNKNIRTAKKIVVVFVFLIMLATPIVIMKTLSQKEMGKYKQYGEFVFREAAYGEAKAVTREDIKHYYTFAGEVTSNKYEFIQFGDYGNTPIKTIVGVGDEVEIGEVVAYVGETEIIANSYGIVESILAINNGYIKLSSLEELKIVCMSDMETIDKIKDNKDLHLEDGSKVTINSISKVAVGDKIKIEFLFDKTDYLYGQKVDDLQIFTGVVYKGVLVVDKDCVYQKVENGPYYVRTVNEELTLLSEVQVDIGFEGNEVVSVVNLEEGTLCDSGYKVLINSMESSSYGE